MKTVLSISSQVVRGHVGNSAAVFALQCQGFEVWPVPTVILSNHPGHGVTAGTRVEAETIACMLETLEAQGRMAEIDAVLTGYFADAAQVAAAVAAISKLKVENPGVVYLCDPVLGDTGKGLYVDRDVAEAVRDGLVPLADMITPNLFELEYLSDRPAGSEDLAVAAARTLAPETVMVTSAPARPGRVATLLVSPAGAETRDSARLENVPNGTGDLLAALALAARLLGLEGRDLLDAPLTALETVIADSVSAGSDELRLVANRNALNLTRAS